MLVEQTQEWLENSKRIQCQMNACGTSQSSRSNRSTSCVAGSILSPSGHAAWRHSDGGSLIEPPYSLMNHHMSYLFSSKPSMFSIVSTHRDSPSCCSRLLWATQSRALSPNCESPAKWEKVNYAVHCRVTLLTAFASAPDWRSLWMTSACSRSVASTNAVSSFYPTHNLHWPYKEFQARVVMQHAHRRQKSG